MELFKLGKGAFHHYRNSVRGNQNISFEEAQRKLTRNIQLAIEVQPEKYDDKQLYMYGKLGILVVRDKIIWVKNNLHSPKSWKKDRKKLSSLNKELAI